MKSSTTSSAFVRILSARLHQPGKRTNITICESSTLVKCLLARLAVRLEEVRLRYSTGLSRCQLTCVISDACSII